MILAIFAIVVLVILLIEDLEFWPPVLSWILLPFAVIYGLWWSNGLQIFPFTGEIADEAVYTYLWDATLLAGAFFGTAGGWLAFKALSQKDENGATNADRLGELLMASKYSFEGKR